MAKKAEEVRVQVRIVALSSSNDPEGVEETINKALAEMMAVYIVSVNINWEQGVAEILYKEKGDGQYGKKEARNIEAPAMPFLRRP